MASTAIDIGRDVKSASAAQLWYLKDIRTYVLGFLAILVMYVGIRLYQGAYAFETGLDSTMPMFKTYWYNMLYVEIALEVALAAGFWWYLTSTRDRNLDALTRRNEIQRHFTLLMWIGIYGFGVYWAGSYFAEQDNAWHQVAIRDTPFTPNHIVVFYLTFPLYAILGMATWLYARTRLPLFAKGISLPLTPAVVGPFMLLPGIGYNEWGHTFWFREELFASPVYYEFVVAVWFAHGLGGTLMQVVMRMSELLKQVTTV